MATHGADREAQRRADYLRSEVMAVGERLRDVESRLADTLRRLDAAEQAALNPAVLIDPRFGIWPRR